jgi:hypothetical protein
MLRPSFAIALFATTLAPVSLSLSKGCLSLLRTVPRSEATLRQALGYGVVKMMQF